jgi:uncharacterized SAM-binding protein YcdF (DUF218 family)
MYFILSKLFIFLLYPVIWVFAMLLIALLAKDPKRRKHFLISGTILLYVFSTPVFLNAVAAVWNVDTPVKKGKVYSCAIILGGFSSLGKNGQGYFNDDVDRFIQGIKALQTGKATHILITGGNGSLVQGTFREGVWVKKQLDSLKIPDSCVLIESNSRNTIENAAFSKPVLQKAGLKAPYLLITSDFHMRRANMIFKKQGYDVDLYPANYTGGSKFLFDDLIPSGGEMARWNLYFKEMIGYVVDKWKIQ